MQRALLDLENCLGNVLHIFLNGHIKGYDSLHCELASNLRQNQSEQLLQRILG